MSMNSLEDAIELIKQGKPIEAQEIIKPLIAADHQNLPAWFCFIDSCANDQQRLKVLGICLEYNPDNKQVKQMMDKFTSNSVENITNLPTKSDTKPFRTNINPLAGKRSNQLLITIFAALLVNALIFTIVFLASAASSASSRYPVIDQPFEVFAYLLLPLFGTVLVFMFSPFFPLGLGMIFPNPILGNLLGAMAYLVYPALFLFGVYTKNHKVFVCIYIILIILLITNIAGCASIAPTLNHSGSM